MHPRDIIQFVTCDPSHSSTAGCHAVPTTPMHARRVAGRVRIGAAGVGALIFTAFASGCAPLDTSTAPSGSTAADSPTSLTTATSSPTPETSAKLTAGSKPTASPSTSQTPLHTRAPSQIRQWTRPVLTAKNPDPAMPPLPRARASAGATVKLTGKWSAGAVIDAPGKSTYVRCSQYKNPAGVQRVFEVTTDPSGPSEYGLEPGHFYVKSEVGSDGLGRQHAFVIISISDGDLFRGYLGSDRMSLDKAPTLAYKVGSGGRSLGVAAVLLIGNEVDYRRSDGIGWVAVSAAINCPS